VNNLLDLSRLEAGVAVPVVDLGEGVIASAIDDDGDVAGLGAPLFSGSPQGPFLYDGQFHAWSPPAGWLGAPPTIVALDNAGQIAFYGSLADGSNHSFRRNPNGRFVDVGSIFPKGDSVGMIAVGMNDSGEIVGWGTDYTMMQNGIYATYTWTFGE